ncbi:hypothetical protein PCE1_001131 [Barthelona sp. PCE]
MQVPFTPFHAAVHGGALTPLTKMKTPKAKTPLSSRQIMIHRNLIRCNVSSINVLVDSPIISADSMCGLFDNAVWIVSDGIMDVFQVYDDKIEDLGEVAIPVDIRDSMFQCSVAEDTTIVIAGQGGIMYMYDDFDCVPERVQLDEEVGLCTFISPIENTHYTTFLVQFEAEDSGHITYMVHYDAESVAWSTRRLELTHKGFLSLRRKADESVIIQTVKPFEDTFIVTERGIYTLDEEECEVVMKAPRNTVGTTVLFVEATNTHYGVFMAKNGRTLVLTDLDSGKHMKVSVDCHLLSVSLSHYAHPALVLYGRGVDSSLHVLSVNMTDFKSESYNAKAGTLVLHTFRNSSSDVIVTNYGVARIVPAAEFTNTTADGIDVLIKRLSFSSATAAREVPTDLKVKVSCLEHNELLILLDRIDNGIQGDLIESLERRCTQLNNLAGVLFSIDHDDFVRDYMHNMLFVAQFTVALFNISQAIQSEGLTLLGNYLVQSRVISGDTNSLFVIAGKYELFLEFGVHLRGLSQELLNNDANDALLCAVHIMALFGQAFSHVADDLPFLNVMNSKNEVMVSTDEEVSSLIFDPSTREFLTKQCAFLFSSGAFQCFLDTFNVCSTFLDTSDALCEESALNFVEGVVKLAQMVNNTDVVDSIFKSALIRFKGNPLRDLAFKYNHYRTVIAVLKDVLVPIELVHYSTDSGYIYSVYEYMCETQRFHALFHSKILSNSLLRHHLETFLADCHTELLPVFHLVEGQFETAIATFEAVVAETRHFAVIRGFVAFGRLLVATGHYVEELHTLLDLLQCIVNAQSHFVPLEQRLMDLSELVDHMEIPALDSDTVSDEVHFILETIAVFTDLSRHLSLGIADPDKVEKYILDYWSTVLTQGDIYNMYKTNATPEMIFKKSIFGQILSDIHDSYVKEKWLPDRLVVGDILSKLYQGMEENCDEGEKQQFVEYVLSGVPSKFVHIAC